MTVVASGSRKRGNGTGHHTIVMVSGSMYFVSSSFTSSMLGAGSVPLTSSGQWEIDPDDGESVQFRIPKEKFGGANDRIGFYISSSGRIGVGTKDPETAFDVRDNTEDVDPSDKTAKTKLLKISRKTQEFDTPVTASIISASGNVIGANVLVPTDGLIANLENTSQNIKFESTSELEINSSTVTIDAAVVNFDSSTGDITFKDSGTAQFALDMDGTAGAQVFKLQVAGDDLIFESQGGDSLMTLKSEGQTEIHGNITASGNISASGTIITSTLSGGATGDQSGSLYLSGSLTFRDNAAFPAISSSALYVTGSDGKGTSPSELRFGGMPIGPYTTIMINCGWQSATANKVFLPFAESGLTDLTAANSTTEYHAIIMPFDGYVDQVLVRSENDCGDVIVGTHIQSDGTENPSTTAGEGITIDMSTDDTTKSFKFASSTFTAGQILSISFDPANSGGDCVATLILKYDLSKPHSNS